MGKNELERLLLMYSGNYCIPSSRTYNENTEKFLSKWSEYAKEEPIFIGEGGNWQVFRSELLPDIQKSNLIPQHCILKCPKNGRAQINIENFKLLKAHGFPCLDFMKEMQEYKGILICSDLNYDYKNNQYNNNHIYVSPNTSRGRISDNYKDMELEVLTPIYETLETRGIGYIDNIQKCIQENSLYFFNLAKKGICISEDCLFAGVTASKEKTVNIDLIVADLDTIAITNTEDKDEYSHYENFKISMNAMLSTLDEFLYRFSYSDKLYREISGSIIENEYNTMEDKFKKYKAQ